MKNQEYIEYTYLHRKVVMYLANKYIKKDKEKILNKNLFSLSISALPWYG